MSAKPILFLAALCVLIGCSKGVDQAQSNEQTPTTKQPRMDAARKSEETVRSLAAFRKIAESARTSPPAQRLTLAQFFGNIQLTAYEKVGRKNPRWDNEAKQFLSLFSTNFLRGAVAVTTEPAPLPQEVADAAEAAEKAGCEDPLVRYLILHERYDPFEGGAEVTNLWVQVADELEKTEYHSYWKFFSRLNAAYALRAEARKNKTRSNVQAMGNQCNVLSIEMLQDHSLPVEAIYSILDELYLKEIKKQGTPGYAIRSLQPRLIEGWGDTAEAWYCIGRFHISQAWETRGSGPGKTVTLEGVQAMAEHLGIARIALEKSWNIKPMEDTAGRMITVEMGDTQGREQMEKWFERAMQQNPASYEAAMAKFQWLTKSWHGNDALVIAFGRECVTNTAYRGRVPLVNREVHRGLAVIHRMNGKGEEEDYWREPGVWPDVKATFDRFFEVNPDNVSSRYDYALLAYHARAWNDLRAQIKLLPEPIDYEYFGGKESFQQMLTEAGVKR